MGWPDSGWIQALAGVIQAIGIIFAIQQVKVALRQTQVGMEQLQELKRQIATDHELARRSRAIDDVREYTNSLDKCHTSARRLVDDFSGKQIDSLLNRKPCVIAEDNKKIAEYALSDILDKHPIELTNEGIKLDEAHLAHLLMLCSGFLNKLETALLGWHHGISDKEVIETQFKYVISAYRDHYILEKFRAHEKVRGNYPAIESFVSLIKKSSNATVRPPIA